MRMLLLTASMDADDKLFQTCVQTSSLDWAARRNTPEDNLGVVGSYQWLYERYPEMDLLAFIHNDVEIFEHHWDARVLAEFKDPAVGVVGFGGAVRHGHPDLYKVGYHLQDLARFGYRSNVRDAETHGERFTGSCEVAVLDGFALIVRRELLDRVGGWPVGTPVDYIAYDYWISAMARRLGYRIRLVGVDCQHHGGRTFVKMNMSHAVAKYDEAHAYIYENFRDCLPYEVPR